ncbi:MAG: fibronectin type III domain-containing protein, partial [Actinomycetales bacterium]|nr:fibronectin type III domain-containing protein [Actinomycetales bacterium]
EPMRKFIKLLLASTLVIGGFGLTNPVQAKDLSDFGYSADGLIVDKGNSIWVVSPQCANNLVVTFKTGRTQIVPLEASRTYWPEIGSYLCRSVLYNDYQPKLVAKYELWTSTGNVTIYPLPNVQLSNVVATPADKMLNISWDEPENSQAIQSYYVWVRNGRLNAWVMQQNVKISNNSISIPVPFNAEDWQVDIAPITIFDNGSTTSIVAPANRLPSAPSRVSLVAGDHQIELVFNPAIDETAQIKSWNVRIAPTGQLLTLAPSETHAVISDGIANNVTYSVTVSGNNMIGTGPSKASNSVTPRATPLTPNGLKVRAVGTNGARVTWNQSRSDITGYLVTHVQSGQQLYVPASSQWAQFDDLRVGGSRLATNTFTVVAQNDYLSSLPASTNANLVPSAPTNLYLESGQKSVTASWSQPTDQLSDILGYTLTLTGSDGSAKRLTLGSDSETVTITGLKTSVSYSATVVATNSWGVGAESIQSNTVTPQDVPGTPTRVTVKQTAYSDEIGVGLDVTLGAVDTNGCRLNDWTVNYSWADESGIHQDQVTQTAALGMVHLTGLQSDTDYSVTVSASNCWGSGSTNTFSVHTYSKPLAVTAVSAIVNAEGEIVVTWDLPPAAKATSLLVTLNPGSTTVQVSTKAKRVIFSDILLGSTYSASVVTRNAYGSSSPVISNEVTAETLPDSVSGLTVTVDATSAIAHVTWDAPAATGTEITGYEVWVDDNEHQVVTTTAIDIDGLLEGDIHTFSVFAINHLGNGPTTTETFGLSMPTLEPDAQGTVIVWHLDSTTRKVRYVTIQKRVGKNKWKDVAQVRSTRKSFNLKSKNRSDVFRVVVKVKRKALRIKSKIYRIHLS